MKPFLHRSKKYYNIPPSTDIQKNIISPASSPQMIAFIIFPHHHFPSLPKLTVTQRAVFSNLRLDSYKKKDELDKTLRFVRNICIKRFCKKRKAVEMPAYFFFPIEYNW